LDTGQAEESALKTTTVLRPYVLLLALLCAVVLSDAALAHQPFFEEPDTTPSSPMSVSDPEISTALYSTLEWPGDVDYFSFTVSASQTIEIGMTIPQIEGQEQFAPTIGVIAAGLSRDSVSELPSDALQLVSEQMGAELLEAAEATIFFEPFSRTAYWRRQRRRITFPSAGEAVVVVWHPQESVGRYTLVVGQREVPGGDFAFARKLRDYWKPVMPAPAADTDMPDSPTADPAQHPPVLKADATESGPSTPQCSWLMRLLAYLLGEGERCR